MFCVLILSGVDIPEINEEQSKVYNNALINWHQPEKDKADSYVLEYRKINRDEEMMSWNELEVHGTSKVVSNLESNSHYAFRVRAYRGSICSPCSRELVLHTPPAPGTGDTGIRKAEWERLGRGNWVVSSCRPTLKPALCF